MLKSKRLALLSIFLILSLLFVGGCNGKQEPTKGQDGAKDKEMVKIGVALPMTGVAALYGEQVSSGMKVAKEEIENEGGILGGRFIELIIEDDKASPEEGVNAVQKLINRDHVKVIAGGVNSSVTLAQLPVTKAAGVLQVVSVSKAPHIREQGHPYLFGINLTTDMTGDYFYSWIAKNLPIKEVAVLTENTDYARAELEGVERNWAAKGPKIVATEWFQLGETNFTIQLSKIKSLNPDALLIVVASPATNGTILRQANEVGFNKQIFIAPSNLNNDVVQIAGKEAEGVISADHYVQTLDNPENKKFLENYQTKYGKLPEGREELGYESIILLAKAIDSAGTSEDPVKIAEVLKNTSWKTPRGEFKFDEKGNSQGQVYVIQVKDGKIITSD
jgi:branched-chain amino acid transport system substrate-binding protein